MHLSRENNLIKFNRIIGSLLNLSNSRIQDDAVDFTSPAYRKKTKMND